MFNKVELDLTNFTTKGDVKWAADVKTSSLSARADLASLNSYVEQLDIEKVKTGPADLGKVRNAVDNDVFKKAVCGKLFPKVKAIDTNGFVLKTQYNTDKSGLEKEMMTLTRNYQILKDLLKKQIIMLRSLIMRVKYLVLQA